MPESSESKYVEWMMGIVERVKKATRKARPPINPDELLTAAQVAQQLGVSRAWVFAHANGRRKPALPSIKMGGAVRFHPYAIMEFIQNCDRRMSQGKPIT